MIFKLFKLTILLIDRKKKMLSNCYVRYFSKYLRIIYMDVRKLRHTIIDFFVLDLLLMAMFEENF